jgi:feruloyl-CoA synthase
MPVDAMQSAANAERPLRAVHLGPADCVIDREPDGTIFMRSPHPLPSYPGKLTDRLEYWAAKTPDRVFLAQRDGQGAWRTLSYAEALSCVRRIAQALLRRDLSAERPIVILSGNDIEHALLGLAAAYVGIPYAPISPAYSLMSADFGKLRHVIELLTPGMVFAAQGDAFARALKAAAPADVEVVVRRNPPAGRSTTPFQDLVESEAREMVDAAHAKVGPDTIVKFLFTSGSTGHPKAVINTQRMLCSNQAMIVAGFAYLQDEPPVIVDWLPWSHTFGANHNFGLVLFNGGTLYIDEGKPLPGAINATVRNLREIATNIYFNVPKGYEMLLPHFRSDEELRATFFSKLKVMFYAGAGLAQHVWDELQHWAVKTTGERIVFLSSIGSTETSPLAIALTRESDRVGNVGLPAPRVELKLVPNAGKLEARLKGPNITPGYWRDPALTAEMFDEHGFYKIGDALKFVDPDDPAKGLLFDGRIAEDFKLATGTWVSVGPLRSKFIEYCAPYVRDVVIAGADRNEVGVLVFPDLEGCRSLCAGLSPDASAAALVGHSAVRQKFAGLLSGLVRDSAGSSMRICRAVLLEEPPSLDAGEMTDKGSINQRAVLSRRAELVEEMYATPPSARVIAIEAA